jgi:septal ring factor EnvC (AmiA/AmiB activator)
MPSNPKTYTEQCLETLIELVDIARKQQKTGFDETKASIDALTLNIAQLAQQQKATAANLDKVGGNIDKLGDRIDRLAAAIERQNAAIDGHLRLSEAQSVNIAELTRLATKLIDRAAS